MPLAVIVFVLVAANVSMDVSCFADLTVPRAIGMVVTMPNGQRHPSDEPNGPKGDQATANHQAVHVQRLNGFCE